MPGAAGHAGALTNQGHGEDGRPWRVRLQGSGGRGPRLPARLRGAGRGRCAQPAHHEGDARAPGREREPPRGREVDGWRHAPDFAERGAERRAASCLRQRSERVDGVPRTDRDEPRRIETEGREPRARQPAGFAVQEILPDPEDRPSLRRPERQPQREAGRRRGIGGAWREDLVQGAAGERGLSARFGGGEAEPEAIGVGRTDAAFEPGQLLPQCRQIGTHAAIQVPVLF
jgi:hypothetical protein